MQYPLKYPTVLHTLPCTRASIVCGSVRPNHAGTSRGARACAHGCHSKLVCACMPPRVCAHALHAMCGLMIGADAHARGPWSAMSYFGYEEAHRQGTAGYYRLGSAPAKKYSTLGMYLQVFHC
jgi:hypothetical protein